MGLKSACFLHLSAFITGLKRGFAIQVGHTDFVTALAHIPAGTCEQCTTDCLVSGSRDNTVRVWKISDASTLQVLEGHRYQVNTQASTRKGRYCRAR